MTNAPLPTERTVDRDRVDRRFPVMTAMFCLCPSLFTSEISWYNVRPARQPRRAQPRALTLSRTLLASLGEPVERNDNSCSRLSGHGHGMQIIGSRDSER